MTLVWSTKLHKRPVQALTRLARNAALGAALVGTITTSALAQGVPVVDWTAIARWTQQLQQMQAQLDQAKQIYDGFNQITDVKDVAALLKDRQFQQYLPQEYSRAAGAVDSLLQGNIDGIAEQYDYYQSQGATEANAFYHQELQRRKDETYKDMAVGEVVYNQASERLGGLNKLRDRIGSAATPKEVLDLQARIQAESAILQNEVLRMQGLAMIQEARNRVDEQRAAERSQERRDGIRSMLESGR